MKRSYQIRQPITHHTISATEEINLAQKRDTTKKSSPSHIFNHRGESPKTAAHSVQKPTSEEILAKTAAHHTTLATQEITHRAKPITSKSQQMNRYYQKRKPITCQTTSAKEEITLAQQPIMSKNQTMKRYYQKRQLITHLQPQRR